MHVSSHFLRGELWGEVVACLSTETEELECEETTKMQCIGAINETRKKNHEKLDELMSNCKGSSTTCGRTVADMLGDGGIMLSGKAMPTELMMCGS